ncbi:MAG: hypothetical protein JXA73_08825 [Acidobacteria bacterium]|nr:hypothetical protein [Acidobacteriota bacterium]
MKRIILAVCLFLCMAGASLAADIKIGWSLPEFTWDESTVVRVWEIMPDESRVFKGEAPALSQEIVLHDLIPGIHSFVARAINDWESDDSNILTTSPVPVPPEIFFQVVVPD